MTARRVSTSRAAVLASVLTMTALVAFAANSVLCRLALGEGSIDPYSFTIIRLGTGVLTLSLVSLLRRSTLSRDRRGWAGAILLLAYALPFSLAYVRIDTAPGALLLFAAVQVTMIVQGLRSGERPRVREWVGLLGAAAGVAFLVSPGLTAPDPIGAALMITAGVGWGGYSAMGTKAGDPVSETTRNFRRATLLVLPVMALAWTSHELSPEGVLLAASSGALASGLGYTVWYAALRYLSITRAGLVQLSVPVIATGGGVVFVGEPVTGRLTVAGVVIIGSIALGIMGRAGRGRPSAQGRSD